MDEQYAETATLRARRAFAVLRQQPIVVAIFVASLALHLVVFVFVLRLELTADFAFIVEVVALLVSSAVVETMAVTSPNSARFRMLHLIRFTIILAIAIVVRSDSSVVDLALILPFVVETVLFERDRVAISEIMLCVLTFVIVRYLTDRDGSAIGPVEPERLFVPGEIVLASAFTAAFALYAIRYRELSVRMQRSAESLNGTVLNLSEANKSFQIYADSMETRTIERERGTITRELHDTVGYALTNVIVMMNAAKVLASTKPEELPPLFDRIRDQTEVALSETRTILYRLRDFPKTSLSGITAVRHLVQNFEGATGIEITLHQGNVPESLGQRIDAVIFRIVQEGLTNAFRHGEATRVTIQLWLTDDELRITVMDNGRGADPRDGVTEGIGLTGMRERLADFGGSVATSFDSGGFSLRVGIPYSRSPR